MTLQELTAVSPVDGRYRAKTVPLDDYFSEYALIKYRVKVEIEYFIALAEMLPMMRESLSSATKLREIYLNFTVEDAMKIKEIEAVTNHDVKAVEYFIKSRLEEMGLGRYKEMVHFGLTSQDINNTALPMMLRDALEKVYYPSILRLVDELEQRARLWANIPMLARTHGQPATPTRLGKEINVFAYRIRTQLELLKAVPVTGKFGGATGNMNAHKAAFPGIDWPTFANTFLTGRLGIAREQFTTQISNYDNLAAVFDGLRRINTIILDLDRDIWQYISQGYFRQRIKEGEVGSSAMPHKVNPIDFENSEGNLGIADALLTHLASKLPISRLQRDLTDSTVIRNVGVPLAHIQIAVASTLKGLGKLLVDEQLIRSDLAGRWNLLAEAIQTILRKEGYPEPYEALKRLTRTNAEVTHEDILHFIDTLDVADTVKARLRELTPLTYTGF